VAAVGTRVLVYDAADGELLHALKGHKVRRPPEQGAANDACEPHAHNLSSRARHAGAGGLHAALRLNHPPPSATPTGACLLCGVRVEWQAVCLWWR
jgi:hypothetical protein